MSLAANRTVKVEAFSVPRLDLDRVKLRHFPSKRVATDIGTNGESGLSIPPSFHLELMSRVEAAPEWGGHWRPAQKAHVKTKLKKQKGLNRVLRNMIEI